MSANDLMNSAYVTSKLVSDRPLGTYCVGKPSVLLDGFAPVLPVGNRVFSADAILNYFSLLYDAGADINVRSNSGRTPEEDGKFEADPGSQVLLARAALRCLGLHWAGSYNPNGEDRWPLSVRL